MNKGSMSQGMVDTREQAKSKIHKMGKVQENKGRVKKNTRDLSGTLTQTKYASEGKITRYRGN